VRLSWCGEAWGAVEFGWRRQKKKSEISILTWIKKIHFSDWKFQLEIS
jgi:hypothetical protein